MIEDIKMLINLNVKENWDQEPLTSSSTINMIQCHYIPEIKPKIKNILE